MRIKISLTILGMIIGIATATTMNIKTADARTNCEIEPDSFSCAGGSGGHDQFGMGGSGGNLDVDGNDFESSGGSGGVNLDTARPTVGGGGHHGGCEGAECDFDGGGGRHVRGEGNND